MSSAAEQLMAMADDPDPYSHPVEEIDALQLEAARERLAERREQIPVLDRHARDVGIDTIKSFEDLVPLLFSHTTYKSYPDSFVANGRWDRMLAWYDTLAVESTDNVDLSAVTDLDTWTDALRAAGHRVTTSSGTSGKSSFLPATMDDRAFSAKLFVLHSYWPAPRPAANSLLWYQLAPRVGPYKMIDSHQAAADLMAVPGSVRYITDRPMLISDVTRAARLTRAMADGTALPGDVAAFEAESAERAAEMARDIQGFARDITDHYTEPLCISGSWPQHWRIIEILRSLGIPAGQFHPDSLIFGSGGTKGIALPDGYKDTIYGFYGNVRRPQLYGMTEVHQPTCMCPAKRYHAAPWAKLLVLDQSGERLLNAPGETVEGRAAFFDVALAGRWGGVITGDKISVDFTTCECGRPGPTIADNIARYIELEGNDDKLSCAGTMEAYVRLEINADADLDSI